MQENNYMRDKMLFKEILKLEEALETLSGIISHKEALKVISTIEEYKKILKDD